MRICARTATQLTRPLRRRFENPIVVFASGIPLVLKHGGDSARLTTVRSTVQARVGPLLLIVESTSMSATHTHRHRGLGPGRDRMAFKGQRHRAAQPNFAMPQAEDTLAAWLRHRPAKPMGSPRMGSNPQVSFLRALGCWCILNDTAPHTPHPQLRGDDILFYGDIIGHRPCRG